MSRGGRGGARGGMLKGANFDYDPLQQLDTAPSELFPAYTVPVPTPPTEREKRIVAFQKDITAKRRDGPFYTKPMTNSDPTHPFKVFDEDQENQRYKQDKQTDPFTGVPTWSEKYKPKARELPEFSSFPFCKETFPEELWATIEGKDGPINMGTAKKRRLVLSRQDISTLTVEERKKALEDKLQELEAEEEEAGDEEQEEEEADEDFEDDEDEMAGDYDGEQYFDGGEGDDDMDDGGGGGGGDDY